MSTLRYKATGLRCDAAAGGNRNCAVAFASMRSSVGLSAAKGGYEGVKSSKTKAKMSDKSYGICCNCQSEPSEGVTEFSAGLRWPL